MERELNLFYLLKEFKAFGSKVGSEHMIDWQFLSLNYIEQNESNFSPKVNVDVFLCFNSFFLCLDK